MIYILLTLIEFKVITGNHFFRGSGIFSEK